MKNLLRTSLGVVALGLASNALAASPQANDKPHAKASSNEAKTVTAADVEMKAAASGASGPGTKQGQGVPPRKGGGPVLPPDEKVKPEAQPSK